MEKKLFCFIGKPGCGKTALLTRLGISFLDILDYIQNYRDDQGRLVKEEYAIYAYNELFEALKHASEEAIYLELGTNYPELVVQQIKNLGMDTTFFLCLADNKTCLQRARQRHRKIETEQFQRRLNRPFPEEHIRHIKEQGFRYHKIDMMRDLDAIASEIRIFTVG